MPQACRKLISVLSSKLVGPQTTCLFRRCSSSHSHHVSPGAVDLVHDEANKTTNKVLDGTSITTENEGFVSPLVRFHSAIIGYPASGNICDYGLDEDCNYEGDLILESQHSLESHNLGRQVHLQKHWNQQQPNYSSSNLSQFNHSSFDLNIWPNLKCGSGGGGHVVLGRNASGKTLLSRSLVHYLQSISNVTNGKHDNKLDNIRTHEFDNTINPFLHFGDLSITRRNVSKNRNHHFLSHVSFDSHSDLLLNENTTTVHRALIPSGGNRLSPTAKFLIVRLGMYPLLPRYVNTLSTGEMRRVLLVRALVSNPELLMLDNAFDGLDVQGRAGLQDIIEMVLRGFRNDILVQGVGDAKDTARTQVLLLTHRPEEIADGMERVTLMTGRDDDDRSGDSGVRTENRMGRNGEELVRLLAYLDGNAAEENYTNIGSSTSNQDNGRSGSAAIPSWDIDSNVSPSNQDIKAFFGHQKPREVGTTTNTDDVMVHADDLKVTRDGVTLISHLNWTVGRGERWHLAGTNGAGKSTLSRLLLRMSMNDNRRNVINDNKNDAVVSDGSLSVAPSITSNTRLQRGGVGWVSTELHLHAAHNWGDKTVKEILLHGASFLFNADRNNEHGSNDSICCSTNTFDVDIALTAARWFGLLSGPATISHPFLSRRFSTLSQGEQKLLLAASAIAQRPSLLVLDEPCQGLDMWNKATVLSLVEKICHTTDMSLLYVTHHEDELIPAIKYRLCLEDGQATYCGII